VLPQVVGYVTRWRALNWDYAVLAMNSFGKNFTVMLSNPTGAAIVDDEVAV
jgi:hypothetical protein